MKKRISILVCFFMLISLWLPMMPTHAASIVLVVNTATDSVDANPGDGVCADSLGRCSLRAAVMETNAIPGLDTIFLPPGTYQLTIPGFDEHDSASGDLDINDPLTMIGSGGNPDGDPNATIIDGNQLDKVIGINEAGLTAFDTIIQAVTIQNGRNSSTNTDFISGGGIAWYGSDDLATSTLHGNLTIYNSIIKNNTADGGDGGGIESYSAVDGATLTIQKSKIMTNSIINIRHFGNGGGISVAGKTRAEIIDSEIIDNTVSNDPDSAVTGGGIYFQQGSDSISRIIRSNISGNKVLDEDYGRGGGIYVIGRSLDIINSTISGNESKDKGGGIVSNPGTNQSIQLINVTITDNKGSSGGGIMEDGGPGKVILKNTLVAGNYKASDYSASDINSTQIDVNNSYNNLIGTGGSGGLLNGINSNLVGIADSHIGPLADNGGNSRTHELLPDSPAIDAGNDSFIAAETTDQRGIGFPRKNDTVDIGAFEAKKNLSPTDINLSSTNIVENSAVGTSVGTLTAIDPDAGDSFTYSLVPGSGDSDNSSFTILGDQLKTGEPLDYESKSSYSIRIQVRDLGTLTYEKVFTITVANANDPPNNIHLSANTLAEDASVGTNIGELSASDEDAGETFTYQLVTGVSDNTSFTIEGTSIKSNSLFDYESRNMYSIRVRVTDSGNATYEKDISITIIDVNEAPTDVELTSTNIAENSVVGTAIGGFTAVDQDTGESFTYSLVSGTGDTDNSSFVIVGNQLNAASTFDYETKSSYSIRVQVKDQGNFTYEKVFTVTITDVNEAPTDITLSPTTVKENSTKIGLLSTVDPDTGDIFTYTLVAGAGDTDNSSFAIEGNQLKPSIPLDYETKSSYSVRIHVTDRGGNNFEKEFIIKITDVDENPPKNEITPIPKPVTPPAIIGYVDGKKTTEIKLSDIVKSGEVRVDLNQFGKTYEVTFLPEFMNEIGKSILSPTIHISTPIGDSKLPISEIHADKFAKLLGVSLNEVKLNVTIELADVLAMKVQNSLAAFGATSIGKPINYKVELDIKGNKVEISEFTSYVIRSILTDTKVDPDHSIVVAYDSNTNTFIPVPTTFEVVDGKTKAVFMRNGNSIYTIASLNKSFADISTHWAKKEIEILASKLIIKGFTEERFGPDQLVSRAEFISLLVRALGLKSDEFKAGFKDVELKDWYYQNVLTAQAYGLVVGNLDGKFNPSQKISREEMAVILSNALKFIQKKIEIDQTKFDSFSDASKVSSWAKYSLEEMLTIGVIKGKKNQIAPQDWATRAEATVMLRRFLQYIGFMN